MNSTPLPPFWEGEYLVQLLKKVKDILKIKYKILGA
jgi:hypothetical protein